MNLDLLRTFLEVARLRHFSRSAEGLHVTQAEVSSRIRKLETVLGLSVFDRTGRDIRLTPAGHRLLQHADTLMAGWRKAGQDVAVSSAGEQIAIRGSLRVWDVMLQDWLHELRRQPPAWAIIEESHSPEALIRRLLDGLLDVAIMLEPSQLEILQIKEVDELDLVLASRVPKADPLQALWPGYL